MASIFEYIQLWEDLRSLRRVQMSVKLHYLTGIEALNYHGADWHSLAYDFGRL